MPRTASRSRRAPIVEALEARTLLSGLTTQVDASRTLLVRPAEGTPPATIQRDYQTLGAQVVRTFAGGPTLLQLPSRAERDAAVAQLNARPWVVYAEADAPLTRKADARVIPNDPSFNLLWGLHGAADVDINAPEAWAAAGGGESIVVAVLDTGIDLAHPDLVGRIWVNPRESSDGVDSDGNGYVDDVHGWNFVAKTADVRDDNGHGTHVSGTIAASINNGEGVAGVAWGARIMPLKVLDSRGNGRTSDAVAAIEYAAANGARVINASWGGPGYSKALDDMIRSVGRADPATGRLGSVFVAAAGNEGVDHDVRPSYPSNNRHAHTITVGAINQAGALSSFSNYGARTVDLVAPGERIYSTVPGGYASYSGTSMAAPHVSGVVALAASRFPGETAEQLARRVIDSARPLPGVAGLVATGGLLDAYRAVSSPTAGAVADPTPPAQQVPAPAPPPPPPPEPTPTPTPSPTPAPPPESSAIDPLPLAPVPLAGPASDALVRATLVSSDEFYSRAGGTPEGYVEVLYHLVLGRATEPGAAAFWGSRIRAGVPRIDVARGIMASNEAHRVLVAGWYRSDLGRPGSIAELKYDPGVSYWASALDAGHRPDAVRATILSSSEFVSRQGGTAEGVVVGAYRALLGRDPNAATRAAAAAQLASGGWTAGTLALSIQSIEEASRTKVAGWYRSDLGRDAPLAELKHDFGVAHWARLLARG